MFVNGLLFLMYGFTAHLIVYTICKPSYLSLKHFFSRALTYLVFQSYISLSMFAHGFCNDQFMFINQFVFLFYQGWKDFLWFICCGMVVIFP